MQGQPAAITLVATNPDPAVPFTYSVSGAPKSVVLNASTGACSWTPTYDEIGTHKMKFTVSRGTLSASQTAQVQVVPNSSTDPTAALPGGTLDPLAIPKYVTPLVIPPVMKNTGTANNYAIAVRQFKQQILPGGIWNTLSGRMDGFLPTTVWSYGPNADPAPDSTALGGGAGIAPAPNSQFNYPAYTIETRADTQVKVRWINDLVDANGNYLPHLLTIDQTMHWANPNQECADGRVENRLHGDGSRRPIPGRCPSSPTSTAPMWRPTATAIRRPGGCRPRRTSRPGMPGRDGFLTIRRARTPGTWGMPISCTATTSPRRRSGTTTMPWG